MWMNLYKNALKSTTLIRQSRAAQIFGNKDVKEVNVNNSYKQPKTEKKFVQLKPKKYNDIPLL